MDKFGPKVAPKGMGGISPAEQADLDELLAIAAERAQMEDDISQRMPQTPEGSPGLIDANIDGLINQLAGSPQMPGSAEPDMVDPRDLLIERFDEPPGPAIWQGVSQGPPVAEKPPLMPGALGAAGYRAEPKPPEEERVDRYAPAPTAPEPEAAPDVSTPPAQAAPSDAAPAPEGGVHVDQIRSALDEIQFLDGRPPRLSGQQLPRIARGAQEGDAQEDDAPETATPQTAEQTRDVIRGLPDDEGKRRATIAMSGQPFRERENLERTLQRVNNRMSMLATLRDQYEDQRSRRMITNLMQGVARATLNYLRTSAGLSPQRGATGFARGAAEDRRRYEAALHQFQSQWEEADTEARRLDSEERDSARRDRAEAREERGLEMREQQFSQEQAERARILSLRDPNSEASAAERQATASALRSLREMFAAGRRNPRSDAILAGFSRYDEETLSQMNGEQLRELRERIASITTQGLQGFGRRGVGGGGGSGRSGRRRSGARRGGGARTPAPATQGQGVSGDGGEETYGLEDTEGLHPALHSAAINAAMAITEDSPSPQMRRSGIRALQRIVTDARRGMGDQDWEGVELGTDENRYITRMNNLLQNASNRAETRRVEINQALQRYAARPENQGSDIFHLIMAGRVYRMDATLRAEARRLLQESGEEVSESRLNRMVNNLLGGTRVVDDVDVPDFLRTPLQNTFQRLYRGVMNQYMREVSGAAVTPSEAGRLDQAWGNRRGSERIDTFHSLMSWARGAFDRVKQGTAGVDNHAVARYWLDMQQAGAQNEDYQRAINIVNEGFRPGIVQALEFERERRRARNTRR